MKHRTDELTGRLLDEAVFRAEGLAETRSTIIRMTNFGSGRGGALVSNNVPAYSSDWAHGGPIIDREKIGTFFIEEESQWRAGIDMHGYTPEFNKAEVHGPTLLIAAMRAFVSARMGAEVDL